MLCNCEKEIKPEDGYRQLKQEGIAEFLNKGDFSYWEHDAKLYK